MFSRKFSVVLSLFFLSLIIGLGAQSQAIKGKVLDANTNEPLVGATVVLKGTDNKAIVKLDGTYILKNVNPGSYEIEVSYAGYKKVSLPVTKTANENTVANIETVPSSKNLSEVTVAASVKGDESGARRLEQKTEQIVNVLSSKTLQLLPDITVANALQRVSGVTIEKGSNGEGRYPIIRGMEKRYVNTLVNGIKIPSPDNKNRFIPLDLFPSELLERLEVSKSLTPSMEADAIGGTINLVMKDAPVTKIFQANFSTGYNNIFGSQPFSSFNKSSINKQSPNEINGATYAAKESEFSIAHLNYSEKSSPLNTTLGLTFGNRFGKDKKFGIILSGSYQNQYRGTSTTLFTTATAPNVDNIPAFEFLRNREYAVNNQRLGTTAKVDYKINNRNKISLFSTYVKLSDFQVRKSIDTTNAINQTLSYASRTTWQYQSIYNATLQGLHNIGPNSTLDWSAVYSIAKNAIPDQTSFSHGGLSIDRTGTTVKLQGDDILSSMYRSWTKNSDKDLSFYANFLHKAKIF
ncbi:MAG: carboxypeptidase-like regulatory domain-containing protein, partial [Ferruginibacter sp.]